MARGRASSRHAALGSCTARAAACPRVSGAAAGPRAAAAAVAAVPRAAWCWTGCWTVGWRLSRAFSRLAAQLADAAEAAVGVAVVVAVAVVMAVAVRATLAAHLASGLEAAESLCWCSEPPTRGAEHRARSPPARAATTTSCECASVASGREASRLSLATHAAVPAARIRVPVLASSAWQARVFPRERCHQGDGVHAAGCQNGAKACGSPTPHSPVPIMGTCGVTRRLD